MPAEKGHVGASIEQLLSDRKNSVFLPSPGREAKARIDDESKKVWRSRTLDVFRGEPPDNKNDLHCFQWDIKLSSLLFVKFAVEP
jgi:hypothetical protein